MVTLLVASHLQRSEILLSPDSLAPAGSMKFAESLTC